MRSRGRVLGMLGVVILAVVIGYLARPVDYYSKLRELHPEEEASQFMPRPIRGTAPGALHSGIVRKFWFRTPIEQVQRMLPTPRNEAPGYRADYDLRSGDEAELFNYNPDAADPNAITCELDIFEADMPWYVRAWQGIKHRLGL